MAHEYWFHSKFGKSYLSIRIRTRQRVTNNYLFRECFVGTQHWVSLSIIIQHFAVGPVVLNLDLNSKIEITETYS